MAACECQGFYIAFTRRLLQIVVFFIESGRGTSDEFSRRGAIVIVYSLNFYSASLKLSAWHQFIHPRCVESAGLSRKCHVKTCYRMLERPESGGRGAARISLRTRSLEGDVLDEYG